VIRLSQTAISWCSVSAAAGEQHVVDHRVVGLLDVGLALLLDALDRGTGGVVDVSPEGRAGLLEVRDLLAVLVLVVAEEALQLCAPRGLGVVVQHLEHGVLHLEGRAELEGVELLGGVEFRTWCPPRTLGRAAVPAPGGAKESR
jgi:hypothetical protein